MSALSDYAENRLIDHLMRGIPLALPANVYLGLFSANPESNTSSEVVAPSYARVPIPRSLTAWSGTNAPNSTAVSTGESAASYLLVPAEFPRCGELWGTLTHAGVFDAATGGNLLFYGPFAQSFVADMGLKIKFPAGRLAFAISSDDTNFVAPEGSLLSGAFSILLEDNYIVL